MAISRFNELRSDWPTRPDAWREFQRQDGKGRHCGMAEATRHFPMADLFHRMRLVSDSVEVSGLPCWIVGGRASPKSQPDGHQFEAVCFLSFCSTESFSSRQFTAAAHLGGGYFLERGQEQSEHDSLSLSLRDPC